MRKTLSLSFLDIFLTLATYRSLQAASFPQISNPSPILTQGSLSSQTLTDIKKKKIWPHAAVVRSLSNCWKPSCWPWKSSPSEIKIEHKALKKYSSIPAMTPRRQNEIRSRLKTMGSRYPKDLLLVSPSTQDPTAIAKMKQTLSHFDQEEIKLIRKYWPNWKDPNAQSPSAPTGGGGGGASSANKKNKKGGISGGTGGGGGSGGGGGASSGGGAGPSQNPNSPALNQAKTLKNSGPKTASVPGPSPSRKAKLAPQKPPKKLLKGAAARNVKKTNPHPLPLKKPAQRITHHQAKTQTRRLKPYSHRSKHLPQRKKPAFTPNPPPPKTRTSKGKTGLFHNLSPLKDKWASPGQAKNFQKTKSPAQAVPSPAGNAGAGLKSFPQPPAHAVPSRARDAGAAAPQTNSETSGKSSYPRTNSPPARKSGKMPRANSKPLSLDHQEQEKNSDVPVFFVASALTSLAALILILWFL